MAAKDDFLGQPLDLGELDIVPVFLVHHEPAQPQRVVGDAAQRQADGRQNPRFGPVLVIHQRQVEPFGNPYLNEEQINQIRHRANRDDIQRTQAVAPPVLVADHQKPQRNAQHDAQHQAGKPERRRDGDFLLQQRGNGHLGIDRQASAQVALEQVFDKASQLYKRMIQQALVSQVADARGLVGLLEHLLRKVSCQPQQHEDRDKHDDNRQERAQNAGKDISCQGKTPFSGRRAGRPQR